MHFIVVAMQWSSEITVKIKDKIHIKKKEKNHIAKIRRNFKGTVYKLIVGRRPLAASRYLKLSSSALVFTSTIAMWKLSGLLTTAESASDSS